MFSTLSAEYRSTTGFASSTDKLPTNCCILLQKAVTSCSVCGRAKDILELYDEIIFMAEGKIIEHGTFETLIAKHAAFYDFYQLKK